MTNIKTVKTQAFGRELHYVLDPKYAAALTSLTGKKTINDKDIASLETLGIAVNLKPETQLVSEIIVLHDISLYQDAFNSQS